MGQVRLPNAAATLALGRKLGARAFPGAFVALTGPLGAGKTALTIGFAQGLQIPSRVTSPTYALVEEHTEGRLPLRHADLYRLDTGTDVSDLELDQPYEGVVVIEWADRFKRLWPDAHLHIHLTDKGDGRLATLAAVGDRHRAFLT